MKLFYKSDYPQLEILLSGTEKEKHISVTKIHSSVIQTSEDTTTAKKMMGVCPKGSV